MESLLDSGSDAELVNDNDQADNQEEDHQEHHDGQEEFEANAGRSQIESRFSSRSCSPQSPRYSSGSMSRAPQSSTNRKVWKSTNAFINYLQDFRNNRQAIPAKFQGRKFLQYAAEKWRHMSAEEKEPYKAAAAMVKKQRLLNPQKVKAHKRKRPSGEMKLSRDIITAKRTSKKKKKAKRGRKKGIKRQKVLKNVSESESGSEDSQGSSDNESMTSDISI